VFDEIGIVLYYRLSGRPLHGAERSGSVTGSPSERFVEDEPLVRDGDESVVDFTARSPYDAKCSHCVRPRFGEAKPPTRSPCGLAKQSHQSGALRFGEAKPPIRAPAVWRSKATNPGPPRFGKTKPKRRPWSSHGILAKRNTQKTDGKSTCCAHARLFIDPITTHPGLGQGLDSVDGTGIDGGPV
jgi:hypothetical protein